MVRRPPKYNGYLLDKIGLESAFLDSNGGALLAVVDVYSPKKNAVIRNYEIIKESSFGLCKKRNITLNFLVNFRFLQINSFKNLLLFDNI